MKRKNKLYTAIIFLCGLGLTSCNKFLDEMPDNRATLDTEAKIDKILVSAYPQTAYLVSAEFSSDNVDDYGSTNPYSQRDIAQLFRWEDVTENTDDSPKDVWEACYQAIASANAALAAIEEIGNPVSLNPQRGEALAARAYNHFILVNLFAQHYSKTHSLTDLGVTYMLAPETELDPKYERNTVQEVYDYMLQDLEEAIPLIDDATYGSTPRYHMNSAATNALAARVALYMQDWEKAVQYANAAIGVNPSAILRENDKIRANAVGGVLDVAVFYNRSDIKANLLLQTAATNHGLYFGPFYEGARYSHGALIANTETMLAAAPYGQRNSIGYKVRAFVYSGTNLDKILMARVPYLFEYTDPVAGIGYRRGVYAAFTTEETMLVRAEALIHLKRYNEAVVDMKRWVDNTLVTPPATFTVESINTWANGLEYFTPQMPTPKKKLNPEFTVESGTQENLLHALLFIRRVETIHMGLRWFDIKRYGIEIERRIVTSGTTVSSVESESKLIVRDKRQALQIPLDVISAGLTPNPR